MISNIFTLEQKRIAQGYDADEKVYHNVFHGVGPQHTIETDDLKCVHEVGS